MLTCSSICPWFRYDIHDKSASCWQPRIPTLLEEGKGWFLPMDNCAFDKEEVRSKLHDIQVIMGGK
jgi:hypothetical protein